MYNFYFSNNINTKWFIFFGLILHFIAAYFTVGYYNSDEHFQVIGPLEKLLGIENKLAWEFNYRIRSWVHPYFYFVITKFLYNLNIVNPFIIVFILKLVTSIIGFVSITYLYNHVKFKFNIDNNLSKIIIYTFWFYAFLHARTSSENLSISFLIFGMILFDKFISNDKYKEKYLLSVISGMCLGLSMVLRYQIVLSVFFIFLWFLLTKFNYINFKYVILNSLIIIFVLLSSLIVDYFGYGFYNNTFYQFYHANFVSKWFASFGKEPWWYHLKLYLEGFFPPINIIILISILFFWLKEFKNIITFITLPVIIILSILTHKELRFLFPILIFAPFFISYLFSNTGLFFAKKFLINLTLSFNILFFVILFIPATEQVKVYEYLYYNQKETSKVFYYDDNPYVTDHLEPKIYTNEIPKISKYNNEKNLDKFIIIANNYDSYTKILNIEKCKLEYSVYPQFLNQYKAWRERNFNWYIFMCN